MLEGHLAEDDPSEVVQVAGGHFEGEEDQDAQPVEHVVDHSPGEGAFELLAVANLEGAGTGVRKGSKSVSSK